jgi:hypothetical protein
MQKPLARDLVGKLFDGQSGCYDLAQDWRGLDGCCEEWGGRRCHPAGVPVGHSCIGDVLLFKLGVGGEGTYMGETKL